MLSIKDICEAIWVFLKDPDNRGAIDVILAVLTTIVLALVWLITRLHSKTDGRRTPDVKIIEPVVIGAGGEIKMRRFIIKEVLESVNSEEIETKQQENTEPHKVPQEELSLFNSDDLEIAELKDQALQALAAAKERLLNTAARYAKRGELNLTQHAYEKAGKNFEVAVSLVPEGFPEVRSEYLNRWGQAALKAGNYSLAQRVFEQEFDIL